MAVETTEMSVGSETAQLILEFIKKPDSIFPLFLENLSDQTIREIETLKDRGFLDFPGRLGYRLSEDLAEEKFEAEILPHTVISIGNWRFTVS